MSFSKDDIAFYSDGQKLRMSGVEPGSQAWGACMADAATLHAPRQVYPCPCTLAGSLLNDIRIIVHDHGELQMHLLRQSEYWQAGIPECPRLLTPPRHKRCVLMAMRMQM